MSESKTLSQVANILRESRYRIEQMISRGHFRPSIFAEPGKAREWSMDEVIRLGVFLRLVERLDLSEAGNFLNEAGLLTQWGFHGFHSDTAFLVVYKGRPDKHPNIWSREIVKGKELGEFLTAKCEYATRIRVSERGTKPIPHTPNYGAAHVAIVINLDEIEALVKAGWDSEAE